MHFNEIVSIAEKILATTKLTTPTLPPHEQKRFTPWNLAKRMHFQKSDYTLPLNVAAARKTGLPHAGAQNSINFDHFLNAKKDKKQYKTFGQQNP